MPTENQQGFIFLVAKYLPEVQILAGTAGRMPDKNHPPISVFINFILFERRRGNHRSDFKN